MKNIHKFFNEVLEGSEKKNFYIRAFEVFIVSVILLNVLVIILDSVKTYSNEWGELFYYINFVCVMIFIVEYVTRLWACTATEKYQHPLFGRMTYSVTPFALIDLFAILPFFIPFIGVDLSFIRVLRIIKITRIGKLGRYSDSLKTVGQVIKNKKEQLIAIVFILALFIIVAASVMYEVESKENPEHFSSIPQSMWWAVTTLTTVGYGDAVPKTQLGKFIGGIISVSGIVFYALPTAIIGSGFIEIMQLKKKKDIVCPHCGKKIIR